MKKIILVALIIYPGMINAQQPTQKFSFYVQGGYLSSGYIKESALKDFGSAKETSHHRCIVLNAGFQIRISEKWRIGPAFTYDHFGTKHRSLEYSNLSYMLRGDRIWKETRNYLFYSGLAFGANKTRQFEEEQEVARHTGAAYQLYLAGMEIKVIRFAIDINAGYGASGILNVGLKYRF